MLHFTNIVVILFCVAGTMSFAADTAEVPTFPPEQVEFFEKHVRPVLIARCFECHSSDARNVEASLLVESRHALLAGGDSGPAIIPGDPNKSLLVEAIRYQFVEMPPKQKLSDEEIAAIVKWVEMGAPWPADNLKPVEVATDDEKELDWNALRESHWAFRQVQSPTPPSVVDQSWPKGDIDRFILSKLEQAGLKPAPAASREVLIRRAYFDLIGLPPTPAEVDAFVNDASDGAFARLVDRLLESPHYGERWARHWLDVARYSDGLGGSSDGAHQPHAWRYRDWVIDALNRDLPYDQFVRLQIAGDLIDPVNGVAATGFFALGPTYASDGGDPEAVAQAMSETLDDRIDTISRGMLGLTVSCARCHDHKFDPIPQLDYYSLAGVFNNTGIAIRGMAPAEIVQQFEQLQQQINERQSHRNAREQEFKKDGREPTTEETEELARLDAELHQLRTTAPPAPPYCHALVDSGSADMKLAVRGNLLRLGPVAPRRFLRILTGDSPPQFTQGSGRRELAEAMVDPQNPLTARVFVNRVWEHHFGAGLVPTPSNFGTTGEPPTHPELLDWLAANFVKNGWSIKWLHRQMMLSAAYQMSSQYDEHSFNIDGNNRLLWRMNLRRLEVEAWRDALLAVSGDLDRTVGGPPVDNIAVPRRTIYLLVSRNGDQVQPDEFMRLFDFPAMRATVEQRTSSPVPQQYLFMLNNAYMLNRAELLTTRLQREAPGDGERIALAYRLLYGRSPKDSEQQLGLSYLTASAAGPPEEYQKRWRQYAQVLLSSNELIYIE
jgi:hypothetical protein